MKSARVCLLSLACVGGAFAFGMVADAAIDLVIPAPGKKAGELARFNDPLLTDCGVMRID